MQAAPRQSSAGGSQRARHGRCTPCRQRRGKADRPRVILPFHPMHPVQAAPRQSRPLIMAIALGYRCTPCRQRRGKAIGVDLNIVACKMHPVQAAPRQRLQKNPLISPTQSMHPVQAAPRQRLFCCLVVYANHDAPRAGSAEAKVVHALTSIIALRCTPCRQRRGKGVRGAPVAKIDKDAPRAGSAEAKSRHLTCAISSA